MSSVYVAHCVVSRRLRLWSMRSGIVKTPVLISWGRESSVKLRPAAARDTTPSGLPAVWADIYVSVAVLRLSRVQSAAPEVEAGRASDRRANRFGRIIFVGIFTFVPLGTSNDRSVAYATWNVTEDKGYYLSTTGDTLHISSPHEQPLGIIDLSIKRWHLPATPAPPTGGRHKARLSGVFDVEIFTAAECL